MTPIVVTCGEPAGIGPEIAYKAWSTLTDTVPMVWLGDPSHLPPGARFQEIDTPADATRVQGAALPVLRHDFDGAATPGTAQAAQAQGVIDVIARAVGLVQTGAASAVCTAPIHKKALQTGADFPWPGHTEYLAHLAGGADVVMMLASDALRVVPATIHIPLSAVPEALTPALLRQVITTTARGLRRDFGITAPRISVAGLNPHAGEGGAIGREECDWITDLVRAMAQDGFDVTGPHSADTLFHAAARTHYDAVVAMYHDQALIPIKTLSFDTGVNITLGLPFVRTSPDHGTAFDIAGRGIANPTSMVHAIRMAADMAQHRARA